MARRLKIPRWVIVTIIIFTIPFLWDGFVRIWNRSILEIHDVDAYFEYSYVKYPGGKEAKKFFDEYADTSDYKDIAFHYKDSGKKIGLYSYWTVFVLDVYYNEDKFFKIAENLVFDTNRTELIYEPIEGLLLEYCIVKNQPLYYDNCASFFIDIEHHTIRYCFVYDFPHEPGMFELISTAVSRSIKLQWNTEEKDMVFVYENTDRQGTVLCLDNNTRGRFCVLTTTKGTVLCVDKSGVNQQLIFE